MEVMSIIHHYYLIRDEKNRALVIITKNNSNIYPLQKLLSESSDHQGS